MDIGTSVLIISPALGGDAIALARNSVLTGKVETFSLWLERVYLERSRGDRFLLDTIPAWLLWGFHILHAWTAKISDPHYRAGVRAGLWVYVVALVLLLAYVSIIIVLTVAAFVVALWALGKMGRR